MAKINFCCIFGGKSSEHEVSLCSAYGVISNTNTEKYNIITVGITREGKWYLYTGDKENIKSGNWENDVENKFDAFFVPDSKLCVIKPNGNEYVKIDVLFPVVHGAYCEDGRLQGLLDMYNVKYVGPGCASSAVCMDKAFTKQILTSHDIPQANAVVITRDDLMDDLSVLGENIGRVMGYPVFVKPANAGSSVGVSKVSTKDELIPALYKALEEDSKALIEEFIDGKEVEIAVMGNGRNILTSTTGEIDPGAEFYDYETKYKTDTASYHIPARISEDQENSLREYAKTIYTVLSCKGLSRIDFFVCADGRVIFNEINTLPGFTPISMFPKLFGNVGISYSELIDKLIGFALEY